MTELIIGLIALGIIWWLLDRYGVFTPKCHGAYTEKQLKKEAINSLTKAGITPEEDESYDSFVNLLVERAKVVMTAPDPIIKNREFFADTIYKYARYKVLLLTPDRADYLLQHEAISGELKPYLHEAIENEPELYRRFKPHPKSTWEERAVFYGLCAYAWMHFHGNLRALLDDIPEDMSREWTRSALMASCIWAEDQFRESLDLPRLVNSFERGVYAFLLQRVIEGHDDPLAVWEEKLEEAKKDTDSFNRIRLVGCH